MPAAHDTTNAQCIICNSKQSYRNKWLKSDGQWLCKRCYGNSRYQLRVQREIAKYGKKLRSVTESKAAYRYYVGKKTALKMGREWSISFEDWQKIIQRGCFYCKTSLENIRGYSLDRIKNNIGYRLDNVLPCCKACNTIKSNLLTVEETQVAINAILDYRKGQKR